MIKADCFGSELIASKILLYKRKRMRLLKLVLDHDKSIDFIAKEQKIQINHAVIQNLFFLLNLTEM